MIKIKCKCGEVKELLDHVLEAHCNKCGRVWTRKSMLYSTWNTNVEEIKEVKPSVTDLIRKKEYDFIMLYGSSPKNLYLGITEFEALEYSLRGICSSYVNHPSKSGVNTFNGLDIYKVHVKNHLEVS